MKKQVFEYDSYKDFINDAIKDSPMKGRGLKLTLAKTLSVRPAFISQVLGGEAHFSLEQVTALCKIFELTKDESKFLRTLLHFERAGTYELKEILRAEIKEILKERGDLKNRIDIKDRLSEADQQIYYSSWIYSAIHILLTIPDFRMASIIAKRLNLSQEKVIEVLSFLVKSGLAKKVDSHYEPGLTRLHLPKDSPQIMRHHTNWRMRAVNAIDQNVESNLHFSTVVSIAREDIPRIREVFIKSIEDARAIIKPSKEEELVGITLDLFVA